MKDELIEVALDATDVPIPGRAARPWRRWLYRLNIVALVVAAIGAWFA